MPSTAVKVLAKGSMQPRTRRQSDAESAQSQTCIGPPIGLMPCTSPSSPFEHTFRCHCLGVSGDVPGPCRRRCTHQLLPAKLAVFYNSCAREAEGAVDAASVPVHCSTCAALVDMDPFCSAAMHQKCKAKTAEHRNFLNSALADT